MGNCLVTKLKSGVNNNNLPFFGALPLDIKNLDSSQTYNVIISGIGDVITIKDGSGAVIAQDAVWINTDNLVGGKIYSIFNPGDIEILNLSANGSEKNLYVDANFAYLTRVVSLKFGIKTLSMEKLPTTTTITELEIGADNFTMDKNELIQWINSQVNLSSFSFRCWSYKFLTMDDLGRVEHVSTFDGGEYGGGRVEDFVARKRQLGYTSGSIQWNYITPNSTFNGNIIVDTASNALSWTASTITFGEVEIQNSEVAP